MNHPFWGTTILGNTHENPFAIVRADMFPFYSVLFGHIFTPGKMPRIHWLFFPFRNKIDPTK